MEIAPLIHSRTGQCDYNSKFAVRPKNFSSNMILWARSKISPATRNIGCFDGIRRIVAAKNGTCIAGIVCSMKYFVNNCLTGEEKESAQPYSHIRGTLYGVFLGYVFKCKGNEIPIVSNSDLWQCFSKYLIPEWEKKSARAVEVDYFPCDKVKPAHAPNHETEFYDSAIVDDEELFREYLSKALISPEKFAFCSNVENIQAVEDGIYTAVTTSASNVDKLKRRVKEEQARQKPLAEPEKKTKKIPTLQKQPDVPTTPTPTLTTTTNTHKAQLTQASRKFLWIILLSVLIILVVAISFMTSEPKNDLEQNFPTQTDSYEKD